MARVAARDTILRQQSVRGRRDPKDMGFLYTSLGAVFITVMVVLLCLWSRLTVVNLGYDISKLNEAKVRATETNRRLRLELNELGSPARIEKIAMEEFGLQYPAPGQIVNIK